MVKLSVIIPVYNGEKYIEKTLDSLVEQTVEDFEVIIIDDGSDDKTGEIIKKYCDEYVDFFYINQPHSGVYAARNAGIKKARGEYILFLDCGDMLTFESIEKLLEKGEADSLDIVLGRQWRFGDIEYKYFKRDDTLVVMNDVDKHETSLLYSGELGNKAIKKKIIELYNVSFADLSAYGEYLFIMQCVMNSSKIGGCTEFILEKHVPHLTDGYSRFEKPTMENFKSAVYVCDEIYDIANDSIERLTGERTDGDEAYLQAVMYHSYALMTENFYRRFWFADEEVLENMREEFKRMSARIKKEKFEQLVKDNPDLRLPYIYVSKDEAVSESLISVMFDVSGEHMTDVIKSVYLQNYPFFEVFIRRSDFESGYFPEELKNMKNLTVIDEKDFFRSARAKSHGKYVLTLRGKDVIDYRVFSSLAVSKIPASFIQYEFAARRRTLQARKSLKDRGLNIKDK